MKHPLSQAALLDGHRPPRAGRCGCRAGAGAGWLSGAAAARAGVRDAPAHHGRAAALDQVGGGDLGAARGGVRAGGHAPSASSRSTRRRSGPSASAGRRWRMAAPRRGGRRRARSISRRSRRCPKRRRSRRSRPCAASGAGAPRSTCCSRSAAPTSFPRDDLGPADRHAAAQAAGGAPQSQGHGPARRALAAAARLRRDLPLALLRRGDPRRVSRGKTALRSASLQGAAITAPSATRPCYSTTATGWSGGVRLPQKRGVVDVLLGDRRARDLEVRAPAPRSVSSDFSPTTS